MRKCPGSSATPVLTQENINQPTRLAFKNESSQEEFALRHKASTGPNQW